MTQTPRDESDPGRHNFDIVVNDDACLPAVQRAVAESASRLGFGLVEKTKVMTIASELARNILTHAGSGKASIALLNDGHRTGIRMIFVDQGPGIPDIDRAMQDGYSSGRGMGLGLPGSRRLAHEFSIETQTGRGTRVVVAVWKR